MVTLYQTVIESPIGSLSCIATDEGVCVVEFSKRRSDESLESLRKYGEFKIEEGLNLHLETLKKQMNEYFAGSREKFDVKLVYPGTEFQRKVWDALLEIPYGKTRTYKQQSVFINNPGSIRAVGSANGANRIAIVIPCHRVIGEDGSLTGYAGGLHRKKWLLDHEQKKTTIQLNIF